MVSVWLVRLNKSDQPKFKKDDVMKRKNKVILCVVMGFFVASVDQGCQAKGLFRKTKNFFVKAIVAPVKMVRGLFYQKKASEQSSEGQTRDEAFKALVKKRNDLLWVNQPTLLEDLVNNKATKITRGELFSRELRQEEAALVEIEKKMSLLCYEVASEKGSNPAFVKEVQNELVQTIFLKERMSKLLQVIKN